MGSIEEGFRFKEIALETGIRLHYVERGDAGAEATVFIHGYADSWFSFKRVLSALSPGHHAYALDLRGHGNSEKPEAGYSLEVFARDVRAFLTVLGMKRVNLAGHSMGSFIAQRVATTEPDRVKSLTLISSAPTARNHPLLLEVKEAVDRLSDPVDRDFVAEFQATTNPIPADFMEGIISESLKIPARIWREALHSLLVEDHSAQLHRIFAPTLIAWGEEDGLFTRESQDRLRGLIPASALKTYAAGHALHWERPEEFARDLEAFILRT
jgi:non-heme chloroperoxidase